MAQAETNIVNQIMLEVSKRGGRVFRNVRGVFLSFDGKRKISAGLQADGSSDLIGFTPVTITPDMVGTTVCVFTALEIKTPTGAVSPQQRNFIDFIRKNGGIAGVARSVEDAKKLLDSRA